MSPEAFPVLHHGYCHIECLKIQRQRLLHCSAAEPERKLIPVMRGEGDALFLCCLYYGFRPQSAVQMLVQFNLRYLPDQFFAQHIEIVNAEASGCKIVQIR